ncbi:MAG: hypothetical protein V4650_15630 [Pseudomonadota bacterium]
MKAEKPPYEEDFWQGSDRLYIMFSGARGHLGLPKLEYARRAGIIDHNRLLIRDPYSAWYQRGIPGVGDDVHAIARFLERKITESGASDVCFVGNSMGGFAALLFCSLTATGRAVAFAPQTFLSPEKQKSSGDTRRPEAVAEMYRHRSANHIYDLQPWLKRHSPDIQADLYYDANYAFDLSHANDLKGFPNVRHHPFQQGGHRIIISLYQQDLLEGILSPKKAKAPSRLLDKFKR